MRRPADAPSRTPVSGADVASWLLPLLVLVAGHLGAQLGSGPLAGALNDSDDYMRLVRVEDLYAGGGWFEHRSIRINPPLGHVQHWTRPMDALLLAGGLLGSLIVDFRTALFGWALALPVLLHAATLFVLRWAARPFLGANGLLIAGLVLALQGVNQGLFSPGRVDHHALILLCFAGLIGLGLRAHREPGSRRWTLGLAATSAFAVWVSIEMLPLIGLMIAVLSLRWIARADQTATMPCRYCAGIAMGLCLARVAEHPPSAYLSLEYDAASLAHVVLFGLLALVFAGIHAAARWRPEGAQSWRGRLLLSLIAAGVCTVLLRVLTAGFFESPLSRVDPLYRSLRMDRLWELQPAWPDPEGGGLIASLAFVSSWLGTGVVVLVALGWEARQTYRSAIDQGRPDVAARHWGLAFLGTAVALYTLLALAQLRWAPYAALCAVIPFAALAERLLETSQRQLPAAAARAIRVPLILTLTAGLQLPALLARGGGLGRETNQQGRPGSPAAAVACDVRAVARVLADARGLGRRPAKLLCFSDYSPELLYRTPHSVFAIPNHRFQPGFSLVHRVLDAEPSEGLRELRGAGGELVAICPASPNGPLYLGRDNLYSALASGRPPDGLIEVSLSSDTGFRLYATMR